jgi:predicted GIY-YIG superfamily endonuclease
VRRFDRKFGAELLRDLPAAPAVYLFKDERGEVLYAGKAKDIRRRLHSYRNATRRRAHRKMRTLVREASSLEVRLQPSEREALLLENELIRTLRPRYNVEGSYTFLYPAIGAGTDGARALFGFTTDPEAWSGLGLRWYGTFRSRQRARDAFDALIGLLALLGHPEPRARLPEAPRHRGSRLVGLRRLPPDLVESIHGFLAGASPEVLQDLAEELVEKPDARRVADGVQESLRLLDAYYRSDLAPRRRALRSAGRAGSFVSQAERDALFIAARHR